MSLSDINAAIVAGTVRLDVYGEVQGEARVVTFLTADEALECSRVLARVALALRDPTPGSRPEDFV